jgi:formylmethanofuran dehydrogenase subunit E
MSDNSTKIPEWAFEFQGHRCMCMPLGYRTGQFALKALGIEKEKDYGAYLFSELSDEDGSGCFDDGLQAATGCTYGKDLFSRSGYGKMAAVLYKPGHGAVRVHVKNDYLENLIKTGHEFFELRQKSVPPSQIPGTTIDPVIAWIEASQDEDMFEYEKLPDFEYKPVRKSISRQKCDGCGEYTVEADGRKLGDKFLCKTCYYDAGKS